MIAKHLAILLPTTSAILERIMNPFQVSPPPILTKIIESMLDGSVRVRISVFRA